METDPDTQIQTEFFPFYRIYKSGRIHRNIPVTIVPACVTSVTVSSKDVPVNADVSARLYLPNGIADADRLPVVVYYHGGAFCIESAFSSLYHSYLCSFVEKTRSVVVSVEYRLAPEHRLPAAHDDAWAALSWALGPDRDEWLVNHGNMEKIFLAGDSAGANLAHYAAMRASAEGIQLEGMILVHPYFGKGIGRQRQQEEQNLRGAWDSLSEFDIDDERHTGANIEGLRCKKVMVVVAGLDSLKDRGIMHVERLKESEWGGEVELVETEGEDHVFHLLKPGCAKGDELMEKIAAFIGK